LAIVNDHTFKGQVSSIQQLRSSKDTSVCGCFSGFFSDGSDFPRVRLFINLDHATEDNLTRSNVNSLTAMGSSVSINKVRSQVPLVPKEWVVKATTLTVLQNWLKNETTGTVDTSTILKAVEDIHAREASWSPLGWAWRNCPFGAHGREKVGVLSSLSINRPVRVILEVLKLSFFLHHSWLISARSKLLRAKHSVFVFLGEDLSRFGNSANLEFSIVVIDAGLVIHLTVWHGEPVFIVVGSFVREEGLYLFLGVVHGEVGGG
jgi:hypothetical protein